MADERTPKNTSGAARARDDRLKAALKANLMRRKAQSRSRAQMAAAQDDGKEAEPGGTADTAGQDKDA